MGAIEVFKCTHNSKVNGYSEAAQIAIVSHSLVHMHVFMLTYVYQVECACLCILLAIYFVHIDVYYLHMISKCQAKMEAERAKPVPEGEQPKTDVEIVAEVLTKENKSSTFLKNVGLQPASKTKLSKSNAAVSAHVVDLEEKLQESQKQTEEMRQELAEMKKAADAAAAQAKRDKQTDAWFAQLMALL